MDLTDDLKVPDQHVSDETIEERYFAAGLVCLEAHFREAPLMGPRTAARVTTIVESTLEKTQGNAATRYYIPRTGSE